MFQTRIDKILRGEFKKEMYPPSQFESTNILAPLIRKFGKKDVDQLKKEIIRIERRLKLMCYDFPKIEINDIEYLRKFTLFLKIINKLIEKSFNYLDFSFSWEEIISNLLHIENDPNLMITSMIRELKRRKSYRAHILNKKERVLLKNDFYLGENKYRQKKITEFFI